ncbi:MAG: RnfABCDGE type electron transport complex subunit G [Candidatus Aminicenantes bacterium]|nr:RnfABCDGE type electron transport complex subunit G [Candidatus Aminicenantes bacterium]MBL7082196.1 RnfABCDGE type electron transport complex subunit G [Candidatus Aminicenantes bacterium]
MSLSARMIIVLTFVGLLSGSFLATVDLLTKERIELNRQREIEEAILQVVPGTHSSQKLYEEKDLTVYGGKDKKGILVGFAIQASGIGFQGKITLMLGTNPSIKKINSLKVIDQKETPGLGAKINDRESFLKFWDNKDCSNLLTLHKPAVKTQEELSHSEINTITGATISSEAVLNLVNSSLNRLRQLEKEGSLSSEEQDVN